MSQVGKTLLRGHTLRYEGAVCFDARGKRPMDYEVTNLHAKCSCGELSPPNISQSAAKRWHREHKDSLR